MRTLCFGSEGAWTEQLAEAGADGWHLWQGARPGPEHRVEWRSGDLVLPWPDLVDEEPRSRIPARLAGRGELVLVDFERTARSEPFDRVDIVHDALVHRPGLRLVQTSGVDWDCARVYVGVPEPEPDPRGLALATQPDRSELSITPWRPEPGRWSASPPRDVGALRLRSGEPVWVGEAPRRRRLQKRCVWRSGAGPHPEIEATETGLTAGRPVELMVDGLRLGERRAGPDGSLLIGRLAEVDVAHETEPVPDPEILRHVLRVHNRGLTPASFDWRIPLEPRDADRVLELEASAEWEQAGLRIPVWVSPQKSIEVAFRMKRTAGSLTSWTPTQS